MIAASSSPSAPASPAASSATIASTESTTPCTDAILSLLNSAGVSDNGCGRQIEYLAKERAYTCQLSTHRSISLPTGTALRTKYQLSLHSYDGSKQIILSDATDYTIDGLWRIDQHLLTFQLRLHALTGDAAIAHNLIQRRTQDAGKSTYTLRVDIFNHEEPLVSATLPGIICVAKDSVVQNKLRRGTKRRADHEEGGGGARAGEGEGGKEAGSEGSVEGGGEGGDAVARRGERARAPALLREMDLLRAELARQDRLLSQQLVLQEETNDRLMQLHQFLKSLSDRLHFPSLDNTVSGLV